MLSRHNYDEYIAAGDENERLRNENQRLRNENQRLQAENERLKNENIVRITALNNLHHNLRELQRRNAKLEKNEKVYRGIISRLALNPDNAFALRAEVAALAESEAPDDPR